MRSATGTPSRCGASVSDGISSSMISAKERMHDWKNCSVMLTDLEPRLPLQKLPPTCLNPGLSNSYNSWIWSRCVCDSL
jgi:hypothetical protein